MAENKSYKLADYQVRSKDQYALSKYKIVMQWLPQSEHLRVLNAGCGSGEMNVLLCQNRSWEVDAIDVDNEAIEMSQDLKFQYQIKNLNIWQSSIENLPQEKDQYDVIVSHDVLEHIKDDLGAIKKLTDLLKPNGIIAVSVPAMQWLFGYHDEQLGHYRRYNKRSLNSKLSQFVQIQNSRYFGATLIPIVLFYSCWSRKPYPVAKTGQKSIIGKILQGLLSLESKISFTLGTSVIVLGKKP